MSQKKINKHMQLSSQHNFSVFFSVSTPFCCLQKSTSPAVFQQSHCSWREHRERIYNKCSNSPKGKWPTKSPWHFTLILFPRSTELPTVWKPMEMDGSACPWTIWDAVNHTSSDKSRRYHPLDFSPGWSFTLVTSFSTNRSPSICYCL